jgi:large subunit ribosomal protein L23
MLKEKGVYGFRVRPDATKPMIKRAIEELYRVKVKKIGIVKMPSKKIFSRGRWGKKPGYKKALVYLKKGEKIELA